MGRIYQLGRLHHRSSASPTAQAHTRRGTPLTADYVCVSPLPQALATFICVALQIVGGLFMLGMKVWLEVLSGGGNGTGRNGITGGGEKGASLAA